jgi:hypothetical protein
MKQQEDLKTPENQFKDILRGLEKSILPLELDENQEEEQEKTEES